MMYADEKGGSRDGICTESLNKHQNIFENDYKLDQ